MREETKLVRISMKTAELIKDVREQLMKKLGLELKMSDGALVAEALRKLKKSLSR